MWATLFFISCIIICLVSVYLIFNCRYETGIVGTLALGGAALGTFIPAQEIYTGSEYSVLPASALTMASFAAFMLQFLWNFETKSRRNSNEKRS